MSTDFLTASERDIGQRLEPYWRNMREILREVARMARACSAHSGELPSPSAAARAQYILLARVADELSALIVLAALGYEMQALVLSTSAYEVGHLAAFIGADDSKAAKWFEWKQHDKMPWTVWAITDGALHNASHLTGVTSQRQYIFYQGGCLAKHANPQLQRRAPVAETEFARTLNSAPGVSPTATSRAAFAAYIAAVSALVAVQVYVDVVGESSPELQAQFRDLVPRWNVVARAVGAVFEAQRKRRAPAT